MKPLYLLLSLLLATCIPLRSISSTHQYNVYIRSGFSEEQQASIRRAFREWEIETNQTVTFRETSAADYSQAVIIVSPSTRTILADEYLTPLIGRCNYRGSDNNILIATDISRRDFHQTSLHEIGHALGLDHDTNKHQTVMMPHTDDSTNSLTCLDMQSFCKEWHCDASQFRLCRGK